MLPDVPFISVTPPPAPEPDRHGLKLKVPLPFVVRQLPDEPLEVGKVNVKLPDRVPDCSRVWKPPPASRSRMPAILLVPMSSPPVP